MAGAALPAHEQGCDGFVAVDALVGLTILALTFGFTLSAYRIALKVEQQAAETRQARTLLRSLIDGGAGHGGALQGAEGPLRWRLQVSPQPGAQQGSAGGGLCRRVAEAKSVLTGRLYRFSLTGFCPTGGSAR